MARFSVCGEDEDDDLPLNFKRQRTTRSTTTSTPRPSLMSDEDDDLDFHFERQRTTTTTSTPQPPSPQQNFESLDLEEDDLDFHFERQRTTTTSSTPQLPSPQQNFESLDLEEEEEEEEEQEQEQEEQEEEEEDDEEVDEAQEEEDDGEGDEFVDMENRGEGPGRIQSSEQSGDTMGRCNGDGSISVILSDPDVLDCPICLEPLTIPVFQCENGHVACSCCCSKLKNRCASCCLPIGYNRCRAIEKVIDSVKISCQNVKYGCKETVSYGKKHDHEHVCLHAPCSCPHADCSFVGSSKKLYQHFSSRHSSSATRFSYDRAFSVALIGGLRHVILQERNTGVIFIINYAHEVLGTSVNINCIGLSSTKRGFSYKLTAKSGETSLVLHSIMESMPKWAKHSPKKAFLVVPGEFDSSVRGDYVLFKLDVCIRRPSENPAGIL